LSCVERIRNLDAVLKLNIPNAFLADELLRMAYGGESAPSPGTQGPAPAESKLAFGTGWFVASGLVVTNHHVVAGASSVSLVLGNGTIIDADVQESDPANDLAVLRPRKPAGLPAGLPLARRAPEVGVHVFTLGYPQPDLMGSEVKLTDGIVSARSGVGGDIRTLQISAPVQPGNSGGPLLDMNGEVIGIVVAKLNAAEFFKWTGNLPENVNYAVKLAYLLPLLESAEPVRPRAELPPGPGTLAALTGRVRGSIVLVAAKR